MSSCHRACHFCQRMRELKRSERGAGMSDDVVLSEIRALRGTVAGVTETAVAAADGLLVAVKR